MRDEIKRGDRIRPPDVAHEATISMAYANALALVLLALAFLVFVLPYQLIWSGRTSFDAPATLSALPLILAVFLLTIILHEALHAAGFIMAGNAPLSSIKFGVLWRALAPYAHCKEPVTAKAYRISIALPGVVLGLVPGLFGVIFGSGWLAYLGALMTAAAGGDLAVLIAIRSLPSDTIVLDHPSRPGCMVLKEKPDGYDTD